MKHNFQASLAKGKAGEALLRELWPELVPIEGGRRGDFMLNGHKVELKSDQYDMEKTENFFIERWSSVHDKKPGSLWQALEHECVTFIYWYPKNRTAFIFSTLDVKNYMDHLIPDLKLKPIEIYNVRWISVGYKVKRELLKDFYEVKIWP